MGDQDLKAELERLRGENAALKQRGRGGAASIKVSEKGAVSVYGLGRFPVTLYKEQWEKPSRHVSLDVVAEARSPLPLQIGKLDQEPGG